jgi:hypothetical protein
MKVSGTTTETMMNDSEFTVSSGVPFVDPSENGADLVVCVESFPEVLISEVDSSTGFMYTTGPANPFEHPRNHWFDAEGPT